MFSNINIYRTATNNIIDLCQEPLECPDRPKLGQLTVSSSACLRIRDAIAFGIRNLPRDRFPYE